MTTTKRELYFAIAQKYTPPGVTVVPVQDTGDGHRGRARHHNGVMEVPQPTTIGRLWVYLHECVHMLRHHHVSMQYNSPSRIEAEAELEVLEIFSKEGITVPAAVLVQQFNALHWVAINDEKAGLKRHFIVMDCMHEFKRRLEERRTVRCRAPGSVR